MCSQANSSNPSDPIPADVSDRLDELRTAAASVREHAYAPFSGFAVGAAVLDDRGRITAGCNVENASYGLTNCAERVAMGAAISTGAQSFQAVAVVSAGAVSPCGACRQVLAEFAADCPVFLFDVDVPTPRVTWLSELLPDRFGSSRGDQLEPPTAI